MYLDLPIENIDLILMKNKYDLLIIPKYFCPSALPGSIRELFA